MAISYRKLWKTLGDQNLKKTDLIEKIGLSSSTIAKLSQKWHSGGRFGSEA